MEVLVVVRIAYLLLSLFFLTLRISFWRWPGMLMDAGLFCGVLECSVETPFGLSSLLRELILS